MSKENQELDNTEDKNEELPSTNESPKQPETNETNEDIAKEQIAKIEAEKKALAGVVSGKDKQMAELAKAQEEMQKKLARLEEENGLKDRLMTLDAPKAIKDALVSDFGSLTSDNFDQKLEAYQNIYNNAIEEQKAQIKESISSRPEKQVPQDLDEQLRSINPNDPDAMDKIMELGSRL